MEVVFYRSTAAKAVKIEIIEQSEQAPAAEHRALASAVRAARERNCGVTVVVPAKRHAKTTPLSCLVTEQQLEALLKGKPVRIAENVIGRLESNKTLKTSKENRVLLIVRAWQEAIPKVKALNGVESLVVVPPSTEEAKKWREAFDEQRT